MRLADALVVSEAWHTTIANLYRLIVDAPARSNGADTLRISPWGAEDNDTPVVLDHVGKAEVQPGDVMIVETPGGGGYGTAS